MRVAGRGACVVRRGRSAATVAALLALLAGPPAGSGDEQAPLPVREVAPGLFVHQGEHAEATPGNQGGIANIGFVVGRDAVAVIDTGGSLAQGRRLRAAVKAASDLPIRYVINTHMHPDHVLGNAAFGPDDPVFVGHAKLARGLGARGAFYLDNLQRQLGAAAAGTRIVLPTTAVADTLEIDLGGRVLRLVAHPTAHTDNDLSVFDVDTATLWLSDLLFVERIPAIDGSLTGWLQLLGTLRSIPADRAIPGHGPIVAHWPQALDAEERYLRTLADEIRAAIATGRTIEQAVAAVGRTERGEWLLFDDYHARNIVTGFTELEWE